MTHDDPLPDDDPDTAARAADAAVRRALVEGHRQILGFLRRRLGSGEEAEEVLQMFMLRAVERSADLRDVRSVRGWLSRILATTIVDHQRRAGKRRKREEIVDPVDLEQLSIEPDDELEEAICNCLYKLLPTLKPEYAEVIWRIDLLEEPRDRVAASLGVSLNNITVRLHRGRQALKKRLEEMCMTCPVHGFLDCRCDEAERWRRRREQLGGRAEI
ncbi:sigma-70 family RNA polymerase sigma factor [Qipengyuania sp. DY56-A-20]|uniref:Sigma-70 family RNA polymerase sigma factor n=1 Tax=Qipengyuania benthica TaxID=3067651 RepID=A0ABT9HAX9_9SPHN|nr:sigma-70 family RNA polymerase sigma factor [Qipengyuania sp. DY56-A-20]MDP4540484.1 sigma-70 family RNA polymerase sigma factor [Qipengyuania sp. DY56-A-20]HAW55654.1 RNA polymerase subunit sigma-70 [Hyphomonas sp.]